MCGKSFFLALSYAVFAAGSAQAASLIVSIDDTGEGPPVSTYGGTGWTLVSSTFDPNNPNKGFTDNLTLPGTTLTLPQGQTSITAHANLIEQPPGQAGGNIGSGIFSDEVIMELSNSTVGTGIVLHLTFVTDTNENSQITALGLQETGAPQALLDTIPNDPQVNDFTGPNGIQFNFGDLQFGVVVKSDLDPVPVPEPSSLLLVGMTATGLLTWLRLSRSDY